jgi:hypothetical protein
MTRTANQLKTQAQRLDRLNRRVQQVIDALKNGAVLQFDQGGGRPKWWLLPAVRQIDPEVAVFVTRDYRVAAGGDQLFPETISQTFLIKWRNGNGC